MTNSKFFRALKAGDLTLSLLLCILGAILVLVPDFSVNTLCTFAGIVCLAFSLLRFSSYLFKGEYRSFFRAELVGAGFLFIAAILLLFHPDTILRFTMTILGITILLTGIAKLRNAVALKDLGSGLWGITMALGILIVAAGILLISSPIGTIRTITVIIGVITLLIGISQIVLTLREFQDARRGPKIIDAEYTEL